MKPLQGQAERIYDVVAELVRAYQFRDREQICCHGLSISQCYALEALSVEGSLSMGDLARTLFLEPSTATRLVDQLVSGGLADRVQDARDRRVWRVRISDAGRQLVARIRRDLVREHEVVLEAIPEESREAVIDAMSRLLTAFRERRRRRCAPADEMGSKAASQGMSVSVPT